MSTLPPPTREQQIIGQFVATLFNVAPADRVRFARKQLAQLRPDIVRTFDALPRTELSKTVLFVSVNPHSRETRFAAAARLAGWNPLLAHLETTRYAPDQYFSSATPVANLLHLALVCWLFPGALVHAFVLRGDHAQLLALLKHRPLVLDVYDTGAGMNSVATQYRRQERETLSLVDGITHRDLRIRYLQRLYGYALPPHNLFVHDPLPDVTPAPRPPRSGDEIHVVSTGWVGAGDSSILRIARALCLNGIHLHVYFNPFQNGNTEADAYRQLQAESGCLHIEPPAYGDAYWTQLARYDFGLSVNERFIFGERLEDYTEDYIRGCGSSRLCDYIAMDLGVIMTPALRFQNFWARRFASSLVTTTREFMENPRPALEAALRAKKPRDRSTITVQGTAQRLGAFYARVAGKRTGARPALHRSPKR